MFQENLNLDDVIFEADLLELAEEEMDSEQILEVREGTLRKRGRKINRKKPPGKVIKTQSIEMALDTEFKDKTAISVQMSFRLPEAPDKIYTVVLIERALYSNLKTNNYAVLQKYNKRPNTYVYPEDLNLEGSTENFCAKYLYKVLVKKEKVLKLVDFDRIVIFTYLYFSPKDLTIAFGKPNIMPYYQGKKGFNSLRQRRNITGAVKYRDPQLLDNFEFLFRLRDLAGLQGGKGGLAELQRSVGIITKTKTLMDDYKEDMILGLEQQPDAFLEYAIDDAEILFEIIDRKVENFNTVLKQTFKIVEPSSLFNKFEMPMTIGTICAILIYRFLFHVAFKGSTTLFLALVTQGVLNPLYPQFQQAKNVYKAIKLNVTDLKSLEQFKIDNDDIFAFELLENRKAFVTMPWQYCSNNYFLTKSANTTLYTLAGVSGGRTVNERPWEYKIEYGADLDISGAYGSQLLKYTFPIGRPRTYAKTTTQFSKPLTLKKWLDSHEGKLTSNLWKVIVSGKLSFCQDLVYSREFTNTITNAYNKVDFDDPDTADPTTVFVLLRKEIQNGTITHKILEAFQKTATAQELSEIYNLEVQAAMYYLDEDRCSTVEEFCEKCIADEKQYSYSEAFSAAVEERTFYWYGIPMRDIIQPLIDDRGKAKQNFKLTGEAMYSAIEQAIKNIINTIWG